MPEQQKVDETVESHLKQQIKKYQKGRKLIYSIRKRRGRGNSAMEIEFDNNNSLLESDKDNLKEI